MYVVASEVSSDCQCMDNNRMSRDELSARVAMHSMGWKDGAPQARADPACCAARITPQQAPTSATTPTCPKDRSANCSEPM